MLKRSGGTGGAAVALDAGRLPLLQRWQPERVAVFRALQLGDMLCAVPALRALRAALPRARITLVGLPWAASFAKRFRHYLDDFIPFPGYPGLPERVADVAAFPSFLDEVRGRRFDLAIQMHGDGGQTNAVCALFGADSRAGFVRREPGPCDPEHAVAWTEGEHESQRLLRLMRFLGAPRVSDLPEFPLDVEDYAEMAEFGLAHELRLGEYACLHAGARDQRRRWPPEHFAAVGDALQRQFRLKVVLTGSGQEEPLARQVAGAMRTRAIPAAADYSVGGLAALISGARLLVCNDTGVSHLAAALRVPSVVVFRASEITRWAPADRRLHRCVADPEGTRVQDVVREAQAIVER